MKYYDFSFLYRAKKIRISVKLNICKNNTPKDVLLKQLNDQHNELLHIKERARQLETKLATMEQKEKNVQLTGVKVDPTSIVAELAPWHERIDEIYADLKEAIDHYYTMASKEKVLHFRTQIKQHAENAKKTLTLDGGDVKRVSLFFF